MNELKKIKLSDAHIESWPLTLQEAVLRQNDFCLAVEPERKLCDQCDYLDFIDNRLVYFSVEYGSMSFDFNELKSYHERQKYAFTKEPLYRALGLKGKLAEQKKSIWDTTCGTGKDSVLIHHFGASLTSFERHPIVYLLLQDALRRFPLLDFELIFRSANFYDGKLSSPEVIYFDPMYPSKKKSALPRKEMLIFKELVGEDLDAGDFLEWALSKALERVVVKRPLEAPPLKPNPTASYSGKSTRYDMYKIFSHRPASF